ncbi:MAG: aminopeptidase [Candidatus Bathyarchaeia archaeon]
MKLIEVMRYARVPILLNVNEEDDVLIVTDTDIEPLVHQSLAAAAFEVGAEAVVMVMTPRAVHGHEPPKPIAEAAKASDILIGVTSTSMTHTEAVRKALSHGVKYVAMPYLTVDTLTKGAATADYEEVYRLTKAVAGLLTEGERIRLTSGPGTDVSMSIKGRKGFVLAGRFEPGTIACFPDGEAPIAPVEGTAGGVVVFDACIHGIGALREPVRLVVRDGRAAEIRGGVEAQALKSMLETHGDGNSYNIAEFAIGTNPEARLTGNVSEDKKGLGRVHIALGDNSTLSGRVRSKTHLDGVILKPTVVIDDRVIVEHGLLKL